MPAQSRKDNPQSRALDKETKRARGALSCAECRRLKLKCDKTVPCASCKRRGCSAICPNGSLITGQGTRFVLADTEKLHQKIGQMSDRIRQLEDAVAILQSTLSNEPHPLLARDLLKIKSSIELHAAVGDEIVAQSKKEEPEEEGVIDAFGTLAIRDDGAATFYGRSAGSESLLIGETSPTTDELDPISVNQPSPLPPNTITQHHTASSPSTASFVFSTLHAAHAPASSSNPQHPQVQPTPRESIAALSASFPLSTNAFQTITIDMDYLLLHFLPKWEEAWRLAQLYLEQAPWFFGAVTKRQLLEEMLPMWYYEARGLGPGSNTPSPPGGGGIPPLTPVSPIDTSAANAASPGSYSTSSSSSTTTNHPRMHSHSPLNGSGSGSGSGSAKRHSTRSAHDLALLFMIFCFGALTDTGLPAAPENVVSEEFFQLTKAALVLEPVLERPPSVATVQTLSLMAIYEGICSKDGSVERTWSLFGVAVKLAQSIGLHRDCARWKLPPAEVQKRRALFWELFITDCWQSLATGRLATFSLPFVDCELPSDPDSTIADDGSVQPSFPYWKARFGAECVSAVVQGTLTSRAPKYSIILDLDRKVRDMEMPMYTQQTQIVDYLNGNAVLAHAQAQAQAQAQGGLDMTGETLGLGLGETMSRFMPVNYRELTLLYIHRCFFAHAISTHPNDPIKSTYAPSFLAGYRSACTILGSVRQQFTLFPQQIARFWVLWTHAFSATVMLASVATHVSKQTQVAHAALIELNSACELFQQAASHGGRAVKFLPILQRLRAKAQKAFQDSAAGVPLNVPNDIFKPTKTEEKNELEIFGGKTHTVATLRSGGGGAGGGTGRPDSAGSLSSSRASSGSPQVKPLIHHQQQQNQLGVQVQFQVPGSSQVSSPQTYGPPPPPQPQPPPNAYPVIQSQQSSQAPQVPAPMMQQQQLMDEYPAFEGVHPSLVHELSGFDGRIEAQVREAYSMGAGVGYGVIREEDGRQVQGSGVGGSAGMVGVEFEPDQAQVQAQAQAQAQAQEQERMRREYQQQVQMQMEEERGLREREDRQRRLEIERQREQEREREREMAEKREYEYEMQRARQQQQQQHQAPPSTYQPQPSQQPYSGYYDESSRMAAPSRRQRPSQSNLRQAYGPEAMYQSGPPQYHSPPPVQQPQQLQVIPPQQYVSARDTLVTPSSSTMSEQGSPYEVQSPYSQQPYPQQQQYAPGQGQGQGQGQYVQETYSQRQYWPEGYAAQPPPPPQPQGPPQPPQQHVQYSAPPSQQQQQQYSTQVPPGHPGHPHYQQQQQQQHYTPAGVLRGIAADDSRLQETWATYMYNVASPRPFFED